MSNVADLILPAGMCLLDERRSFDSWQAMTRHADMRAAYNGFYDWIIEKGSKEPAEVKR